MCSAFISCSSTQSLMMSVCLSAGVHPSAGPQQTSHSVQSQQVDSSAARLLHRGELQNMHGETRADARGHACRWRTYRKHEYVSHCSPVQIATISPGMASCENTLNTLRYANR